MSDIFRLYLSDPMVNNIVDELEHLNTPQLNKMIVSVDWIINGKSKIQANLKDGIPLQAGAIGFPKDNVFICPVCKNRMDLTAFRGQIESQTKRRVV